MGLFDNGLIGKLFGGYDDSAERAEDAAIRARRQERATNQRVKRGTQNVNRVFDNQFGNGFLGEQRRAYMSQYMPQLREQRDMALKDLEFALARSGLTNSSVRAEKLAELQRTFEEGVQGLRSGALDYRNNAAGAIEARRKALIDGLSGTARASNATAAARRAAAGVDLPSIGGPLANMFTGFSEGLQGMRKRDIYSEFL